MTDKHPGLVKLLTQVTEWEKKKEPLKLTHKVTKTADVLTCEIFENIRKAVGNNRALLGLANTLNMEIDLIYKSIALGRYSTVEEFIQADNLIDILKKQRDIIFEFVKGNK